MQQKAKEGKTRHGTETEAKQKENGQERRQIVTLVLVYLDDILIATLHNLNLH